MNSDSQESLRSTEDIDDILVAEICAQETLDTSLESALTIEDNQLTIEEAPTDVYSKIDIPASEEFIHVDQMELMWRKCPQKNIWQNIFSLICALAVDAVTTEHQRMDAAELYLLIFEQCEQAFENLHLSSIAQDIIFKFLPHGDEKNQWPKEFCEWWKIKLRTPVPNGVLSRELKRYKSSSVDTQQMAYFGWKAKEQYTVDRSFVRSHLCPKWVDPCDIPSGKTVHGLLHAIRMSCIPIVAQARAKHLVQNDLRKVPLADRETVREQLYQDRFNNALEKLECCKDSYFPDTWLTFMFCSLPSPKPLLSFLPSSSLSTKTFNSGANSASPSTAFRSMLGRDRRRSLKSSDSSEGVERANKKQNVGEETNKLVIVHEIGDKNYSRIEELEALIETKQLELSLLQMLGRSGNEVKALAEEILILVREKARSHEKKRAEDK